MPSCGRRAFRKLEGWRERMAKRSEPRKDVQVAVRIFGTDATGAVFSERVSTVNVSQNGVELQGVHPQLAIGEIVGLTYGTNRVHFRVKWVGTTGTPKSGHVGLQNITPEKPLWDFALPPRATDLFKPVFSERRKHPRFRCNNSVEVHVANGASFWATISDLGLNGCYVKMPIPLELGSKVRIGVWIGQNKVWAEGEIAHRTPGMGIGVRFTQISDTDLNQIRTFLRTLTPFLSKRAPSPTLYNE
jgi:PilZ domain